MPSGSGCASWNRGRLCRWSPTRQLRRLPRRRRSGWAEAPEAGPVGPDQPRITTRTRRGVTVELIRWFEDLRVGDSAIAGGKGANLGELTSAGLPVPPGFVVTAEAYRDAITHSEARSRLAALMGQVAADDPASLTRAAEAARDLVRTTPVPQELAAAVTAAYRRLGDDVSAAVRSSGTIEDTAGASFAGMNATFTNVTGEKELLARLVDCWASLYGERVIFYPPTRAPHAEPRIPGIVQPMN